MKKNNTSPKTLTEYVSGSLILPFFYKIAVFLYKSIRESVIGHFFCSYDKEDTAMETGMLSGIRGRLQLSEKFLRPLRMTVASQFDNSAVSSIICAFLDRLGGMSLSTYGLSFLFFSLFSSVTYVLRFMADQSPSYADIVVAGASLLIGICLVASHSHLSDALTESRLTSFVIFRIFGANEEYFRELPHTSGSTLAAAGVGILLGLFTVAVSPLLVLVGVIGITAAFLVYKIPEAGIVAVMFLAPFLPTMVLVTLMMYILACFFLKFLRGKRVIRIMWLDLTVLCFMVVFLCAGLFSAAPMKSVFPVMVYLCFMCGYFLCVNLIRSREWLHRCLWAVLSSSVLVALYGIYQNFFVTADTTWQDTSMFSDIQGRVVSTLENPNVLAEYLIMILPCAIAGFLVSERISQKLCYLFAAVVLGTCLIFTWSRGAWLGLLIAMMIFLLMYSKKFLVAGLFGILAVPFLPFVLPESVLNRFLSIGNLGDTSTSYRVHIWEGTVSMLRDHFLGGIGVGTGVFGEVYPRYSLNGIETAPHAHNLYLQILTEVGILGFLIFVIFLLSFAKRNFTFYAKPLPTQARIMAAALFCGILAILAQGMTDHIWYNYRVFLVFWLQIGLCAALCKTTEADNRRMSVLGDKNTPDAAELTIQSPKKGRT